MPHFEGWASAGDELFLPAVGRHELLVVDKRTWKEAGRIPVAGQPVFAVARPGGRQVWVNFAHPDNGSVQVVDVPKRARSSPRWSPARRSCTSSSRRAASRPGSPPGTTIRCWSTTSETLTVASRIAARKPSGIFFTARANRIGQ